MDGTLAAYGGNGGEYVVGGDKQACGGPGSGGGILIVGGTVSFGSSAVVDAYGGRSKIGDSDEKHAGGGRVAVYVGAFGTGWPDDVGVQLSRSGRSATAAQLSTVAGLTVAGSNPVDVEGSASAGTFHVVWHAHPDDAETYADIVTLDGPIAWWRLNDSSDSATADDECWLQNGEYYINRNDSQTAGSASPGPTLVHFDPLNASAEFDGGLGLYIPNQGPINTSGPWTEKSIECWFQAESTSGLQMLYEQGGGSRGLNLFIQDGDLVFGGWNVPDDDSNQTSPWNIGGNAWGEISQAISAGVPYHAVLVMDGDPNGKSGQLLAYLDGQLVGSLTGVGRLFNHGGNVGIGYAPDGTLVNGEGNNDANYFTGLIDEFALYNRALSEDEIAAHYTTALRSPPQGSIITLR